jgi:hypothetical protein
LAVAQAAFAALAKSPPPEEPAVDDEPELLLPPPPQPARATTPITPKRATEAMNLVFTLQPSI